MRTTEQIIQDNLAAHYSNIRYKNKYSYDYHKYWNKRLLNNIDIKEPILDNGCGIGFLTEDILTQKIENVFGLDISYKRLQTIL